MPAARFETIKDIDRAGFDLRIWCFACARGEQLDGIYWDLFERRGWAMELDAARRRFRCKGCRSTAHVLILPATPREPRKVEKAWNHCVEYWFHNLRKGNLLL